jgi:hypothetical protein
MMLSLHNWCYVFGIATFYFCYYGTTQNAVVGFAPTSPSTTTARTLTRHAAERDGSSSSSTVSGPPYSGPSVKPILDSINYPSDMKGLDMPQIKQVSTKSGSGILYFYLTTTNEQNYLRERTKTLTSYSAFFYIVLFILFRHDVSLKNKKNPSTIDLFNNRNDNKIFLYPKQTKIKHKIK